MSRLSTKAAVIERFEALDQAAKFHSDFAKGVAAGPKSTGLHSDHIHSATDTDNGYWALDDDGREVWRVLP